MTMKGSHNMNNGNEDMLTYDLKKCLDEATEELALSLQGFKPDIAIVLGSGLGCFADRIEDPILIDYRDVPYMQSSTATSHVGRFVAGKVSGKNVICMQGRLHAYEGYSSQEIVFPIWLFHSLGIRTLITTNAAGAINPEFNVGDFCIIEDHINMTGRNPIVGLDNEVLAPRFFSMLDAYDPELIDIACRCSEDLYIPAHRGVYLGLLGPSFETPAEIRAFSTLGADTVAMSVCEEVIAARYVNMKVLGISLCSNMACGIQNANPTDDEVLVVAKKRSDDFANLIGSILKKI